MLIHSYGLIICKPGTSNYRVFITAGHSVKLWKANSYILSSVNTPSQIVINSN